VSASLSDGVQAGGSTPFGARKSARPDHASSLAAALGGQPVGPVVVLESSIVLPLDAAALELLPVPLDSRQPIVCLDLETTGLATGPGTLAFLVGLGWWAADCLNVRLLLLPDHADEEALLELVRSLIPPDATLVTYNGRSFDWPLLVSRYRLHRREPPPIGQHLDLLPLSRQLWRPRLGNARLSTIEAGVCGVERFDDLPGAMIPERYFAYLRDRRPGPLVPVIEHNRQDIVSLGRLLAVLAGLTGDRDTWHGAHPSDIGGLARAYARRGQAQTALDCVEAALASRQWIPGVAGGASLRRRLATDRARLLGRLGRREEQHQAWLEIARRGGPGAAAAWLRVASYREHRLRDIDGALAACQEAAADLQRARLWGRSSPAVEQDLWPRTARLRRRAVGTLNSAAGRRAVA
jgi:uncharacterized protein